MGRDVIVQSRAVPAVSAGAVALGAFAVGAAALGVFAIGRLAIGHIAVKKARFGTLDVDLLTVRRLRIIERDGPEG